MSTPELPPTVPQQRLSEDDRRLVQTIGSRLRLMIQNKPVDTEDVARVDELGLLANMVNRVAKELHAARTREAQQRAELEERLAELHDAYAQQQRLLETINDLSTPALNIYDGILLFPIVGTLDSRRVQHLIGALLQRINDSSARVVIIDITGVTTLDTQVANVLIQAARSSALLGAKVILCGIAPEAAQVVISLGLNLSELTPSPDLRAALERALVLTGCKITRR